ncbi:MAG TPA: TRAP transporter small permease subunit [Gammaproteobacteria bacterium]|jgi:TRAP-type mannitol/chloroaromatic compound transport system permease small subunit|nr:C4-dicarboxylate ABC transporter permease [Chromatiales bacterium]MCP4925137.1 TRAP transporter small permease subunit [Gammaproteobacteria bacterium]MDP7154595.1 TRAP transporter small permease subunit [Gammaproteobacteria bacterium]MDP7296495.1 TRAP transporter small permease subunit [Gammaproteobacteria bacterium]HJP39697.1 TRAP transporter small permease subunit [Gammaproteobacteria bacterium]
MQFTRFLERLNVHVGRGVAWLTLIMVFVTFIIVVMRYLFDSGWIWLQESVTWMHAAVFMLAAAYTLAREEHVRVDIFYRRFTPRGRALVNAVGSLFLLIPVAVFIIFTSWDYVMLSWQIRESSREAGGLIYPFISMLKSLIPLMSIMLLLQGVVLLVKSVAIIRSKA